MVAAKKYGTLYREYRPQTFEETHGQDHIVKVLEAQIQAKRPAHAYLFVGSRGTGKTTFARILARELGVTDKDLYEMDAASHTGVDNIRELREGANVMPFESSYKFYIIDEAHMLSKGAWNAFLKTLEEPPPHVIFVLATTDRDKVPDTIQSRCEIYSFKQPTREVLAQVITDVAKKEGFALEGAASELVALLAEGSFRDGLSILQKVLAVSKDKKVNVSEVEEVSGAPRGELVRQLLKAISEKNAKDALSTIKQAVDDNLDVRVLTKLLIHRLRVVLLLRHAPDLAESFSKELTDADLAMAKEISKNPGVTSDTLRMILDAYGTMAYAAVPHLPLELATIEICGKE
ncbi:DNA polymerase III subunit gamma/tau [Candidatus Kaiserbacteria bacterium]|nr:DNA polymerase III subunit gamma/tau [Candidatus Kaiserbacteria bacterium]